MSRYLFIESRDPFESRDVQFVVETATALKRSGNDVTVFLVQNGVLAARQGVRTSHLPMLAEEGIRLLADDIRRLFEKGVKVYAVRDDLEERGISKENCAGAVCLIRRSEIAALITEHDQVWHW